MEFDQGFANIIVVDRLPQVPKEKFEKLESVIRKIYSQIGVIKEDGFWMPVDSSTGKTLGYCFIEYNTPQVIYRFFANNFHVIIIVGSFVVNWTYFFFLDLCCRKLSSLRIKLTGISWISHIYLL